MHMHEDGGFIMRLSCVFPAWPSLGLCALGVVCSHAACSDVSGPRALQGEATARDAPMNTPAGSGAEPQASPAPALAADPQGQGDRKPSQAAPSAPPPAAPKSVKPGEITCSANWPVTG